VNEGNAMDSVYFSVADSDWTDLDPKLRQELKNLYQVIGAALAEADRSDQGQTARSAPSRSPEKLSPARLALRMHEVAGAILEDSARDEYDLRQLITTLRTALTVAFDLYGAQTAERVTVAQHMRSLKEYIVGFEQELKALREKSEGS